MKIPPALYSWLSQLLLHAGIQQISQPVAQQIQTEYRQNERGPGEYDHPPCLINN